MHAELQRRVEELEKLEARSEDGASQPATPASGCSATRNGAGPLPANEENEADGERREYIGGVMPEHSRMMVAKMMEEAQGPEDDKDAVAKMLAEAEALDPQEQQHRSNRPPAAAEEAQDHEELDDKDAVAKMLAA